MRVIESRWKRPLDVLAVGAGGHVAAACSAFLVRGDADVWDAATGRHLFTHPRQEVSPRSLAFTPDGAHLIVGVGRAVAVLDAATGADAHGAPVPSLRPMLALSPDGARLLVTASDNADAFAICYDLGGFRFTELWSVGPWERNAVSGRPAFAPDGVRVAVPRLEEFRDRVRNTVRILDAATGRELVAIPFDPRGTDLVEQVAFSADGAKLLARSAGRTVKVFDAATGQPAGELVHPGRPYVTGMAVHPTGVVACSRTNGAVCFWDLEKRELVRTLDWKLGKLVSVAFSPDGSIGAAGTEDGKVVVWDVDV